MFVYNVIIACLYWIVNIYFCILINDIKTLIKSN